MQKRLLFLGYDKNKTRLLDVIEEQGWTIVHKSGRETDFSGYELVISFGYKHKLTNDALRSAKRPILNLHMSYLPYNRGAHPSFWSFYDGTPSGVTIHEMDKTIDGGPICYQKYVNFTPQENTFSKTYDRLTAELERLFCDNLENLLSGNYATHLQRGAGTFHTSKELPAEIADWNAEIQSTLKKLDQTFHDRQAKYMALVEEIQAVRTSNNVNWMDLLRIALTHAPEETKQALRKINADDDAISRLFKELGK